MYDIITIGDTTLDTFMRIPRGSAERVNKNNAYQLCVPFGDKVPIDYCKQSTGGNAANVAVGSVQLGLKTAIYTVLGSGYIGKLAHEQLVTRGVAERLIIHQRNSRTNAATILNYKGERTIFSFHEERAYTLPKLQKTAWIYLTSVGKNFQTLYRDVLVQARYQKAKIVLNPGSRQIAMGIKTLAKTLSGVEVLVLNQQEAEKLVGKKPKDLLLCKALARYGPKVVVLTDGLKGTLLYDGERLLHCGIYRVKTIAQTGAGDAFSAGFVAALANGHTLEDALHWGAANAASVVQQIGAQEGLLSARNMENFFRTHQMPKITKHKTHNT